MTLRWPCVAEGCSLCWGRVDAWLGVQRCLQWDFALAWLSPFCILEQMAPTFSIARLEVAPEPDENQADPASEFARSKPPCLYSCLPDSSLSLHQIKIPRTELVKNIN